MKEIWEVVWHGGNGPHLYERIGHWFYAQSRHRVGHTSQARSMTRVPDYKALVQLVATSCARVHIVGREPLNVISPEVLAECWKAVKKGGECRGTD